ncbi:MAG TPA: hypothetical protein VEA99_17755 [Gemmatimonadaceae bacterium]|nr:hypothetical protein [Gemmatimonadaceae bacterium]
MQAPATSSPRAALARGGITWVTALLLFLLGGGGYLAITWGPVWFVHLEVKQVVHDYMNQAVKNANDAELVEKMVHKLRTLDEQDVPGDDGELVRTPTIEVDPGAVTWERDAQAEPPTLHVAFEYTRAVRYPILDRWTEVTLDVDLTKDVARPDWGPSR